MVVLGPAALYECGRGELLSSKVTFPKHTACQGICGFEVLSLCWAPWLQDNAMCSFLSALSWLFCRELEKRAMSPGGEGTTIRLDRASEKCAVSRAGQGGIPGWKVCFHIHFVPSLSTKCHTFGGTLPAHHCRHQHRILCHTPSMPVPPPCLPKGNER